MAKQKTDDKADPKARWTVMVFMSAEIVPGDADLSGDAESDIAEMTSVANSETLNIFFQLHEGGIPQRCHVGKGDRVNVPDGERDATSGNALVAFVKWALQTARHMPSDYSLLVLWGHAYRFGIGRAVGVDGIDAIDVAELAAVLAKAQAEYKDQFANQYQPTDATPRLDMIGFDACDLSTIEMAVQLAPFARYMVSSQVGIPLPGWPYDRVLDRISQPKDRLMGPAELGSYIVRRYCETYRADSRAVSLTLLDLGCAATVFELTESLARRLALGADRDVDELQLVEDLFRRSQTWEGKPFVDVADLCLSLWRYSTDQGIRQAAEKLGDFLISPSPVKPGASVNGVGRPFVAEHGRNAARTARLHGVSLYAPHVAPDYNFETSNHWYEKFVFAKRTVWSQLVSALAQTDA